MILLDTHVLIWLNERINLETNIIEQIERAGGEDGIGISVVSAWELGVLVAKKRLALSKPAEGWFATALQMPGTTLLGLTPDLAIAASFLPNEFHQDPADRLLVATARHLDIPIMTRDKQILAYGRAGHVKTIRA